MRLGQHEVPIAGATFAWSVVVRPWASARPDAYPGRASRPRSRSAMQRPSIWRRTRALATWSSPPPGWCTLSIPMVRPGREGAFGRDQANDARASSATCIPALTRSPAKVSGATGGVGPMTRAMLLTNIGEIAEWSLKCSAA